MKMGKFQIRLPTLLLLPLMFAAGWWTRGINYDREVRAAIDQQALESGGFFVPEMGIIRGNGITAKKLQSMSPDARKEMDRRLKYYAENFPQDASLDSDDQSDTNASTGFPKAGFSASGFGIGGVKAGSEKSRNTTLSIMQGNVVHRSRRWCFHDF